MSLWPCHSDHKYKLSKGVQRVCFPFCILVFNTMFLYWIYCILLSPFLLEYLPFMVSNWGQRCLNLGNFNLREFSLSVINFSSDNANFIPMSQWYDWNKQTIETSTFCLFYILLIFMLWYSSFTRHKKKRKKEREKRQVTPFFWFYQSECSHFISFVFLLLHLYHAQKHHLRVWVVFLLLESVGFFFFVVGFRINLQSLLFELISHLFILISW